MAATSSSTPIRSIPLEPILSAAKEGKVEQIRDLLLDQITLYTRLNCRDLKGRTPLHCAIKGGHLEAILLLLKSGARFDLADFKGKSPLDFALRRGDDQAIRLLLFGAVQPITSPSSSSSSSSSTSSSSSSSTSSSSSNSSSQTKSRERLTEESLAMAFQRDDIDGQIFSLTKRAFFFLEQGDEWRATLTLNSAYTIAQNSSISPRYRELLFNQLEQIESRFICDKMDVKSTSKYRSRINDYRSQLQEIRQRATLSLDRGEKIRAVLFQITEGYKHLIRVILLDCIEASGQRPPTRFAMAGLGSMSRDEMAPYSDVEFIFLIEEDTEENRAYFRTIARFMALKIANLGETEFKLIRTEDGDKSLSPSGFSIDIGGLSPLGKEGIYELIGTPQELAEFQAESWLRGNDSEIILVNAMTTICLIVGERSLVSAYQNKIDHILDESVGPSSSWLSSGQKLRQRRALELMRNCYEEFRPRLDQDKINLRGFDIKKELYRLPQSVISALALYYELKSNNSFDRIDELVEKGVLFLPGALNLKNAFILIFELRVRSHFFYRTERELLYHSREIGHESPEDLFVITSELNKLITQIYRVLIPLHQITRAFLNGNMTAFNPSLFEKIEGSRYNRGIITPSYYLYDNHVGENMINSFLLKEVLYDATKGKSSKSYDTTALAAAKAIAKRSTALSPNSVSRRRDLGEIQLDLGEAKEAVDNFQETLFLLKKEHGEGPHPDVAASLLDLGNAYNYLGQYDRAIDTHQQALVMLREIHGYQPHDRVAAILHSLGANYLGLKDYPEALKYFNESLTMKKQIYGDSPHHNIANGLSHLAMVHQGLGNNSSAIECLHSSLAMNKQLHLDGVHPDIAYNLNGLGILYDITGDYPQAIAHHDASLAMQKQIYGDSHPAIATSLYNLGCVYQHLDNYPQAIELFSASLAMRKRIYGDSPHPAVATSLMTLGSAYYSFGETGRAIDFYEQFFAMKKQLHGDGPHSD